MNKDEPEQTLYTTTEVAEHFGVADQTVRVWRKKGWIVPKIPGIRPLYDIKRVKSAMEDRWDGRSQRESKTKVLKGEKQC